MQIIIHLGSYLAKSVFFGSVEVILKWTDRKWMTLRGCDKEVKLFGKTALN